MAMTTSIIARIHKHVGKRVKPSKPAILIELLLAAGLCFARIFPFSVQLLLVAFASLSLWIRDLDWSAVGLRKPGSWWKLVLLAMVSAVAICVVVNLLVGPVVERLAGHSPGNARFDNVRGNLPVLIGWLSVAWTLAAFAEEMIFRAYFMNRISDLLGNGWAGWTSALLLSSVLFGAGHGYQGLAGAIGTTEIGLLLGVMYLVNRRNLWMNIVCHGFIDSISLIALYFSKAP